MIEERAQVTQVDGDKVTVTSEIKSGCDGCQQVSTCANGQVAKALPTKSLVITLNTDNQCKAQQIKVGDQVIIGIPEQHLLRSAWQVYIWPLIGLMLFAFIGQQLINAQLFDYEWQTIILAIIGGIAGSKLAKWWQTYSGIDQKISPKLIQVIPAELRLS